MYILYVYIFFFCNSIPKKQYYFSLNIILNAFIYLFEVNVIKFTYNWNKLKWIIKLIIHILQKFTKT